IQYNEYVDRAANTEREISHNTNNYLNRPLTGDAIQMCLFESITASMNIAAAFIFVVEYVSKHLEVEAKIRAEINSFFSPTVIQIYQGYIYEIPAPMLCAAAEPQLTREETNRKSDELYNAAVNVKSVRQLPDEDIPSLISMVQMILITPSMAKSTTTTIFIIKRISKRII
ncbi:2607_t:CDS:2, partial [Ambispora gerdemannii]